MTLNYVSSLLMPDNSMLFYQIPFANEGQERIANAEKRLEKIKEDVSKHRNSTIGNNTVASSMIGWGYKLCNKTAKFYADDNCIGCGLCERVCPQEAIQYGKMTRKRNRYVNSEINCLESKFH